ncbi:DUF2267 domain-containing protein [Nocardia sp. NPDC050630]|uniref:DUF2267 domain-containing protein n=1 Tax=unclassified Nocardia TaxID=2637762 RepID=UPI0037A852D1
MNEDQLVSAVRGTAQIDSVDEGARAIRATLQVLGQRITGGETKDLASQLPKTFAEALPRTGAGERFAIDEFYRRVAAAEGAERTEQQARRDSRAVMAALKVAMPHEFDHIAAQLPADYDDLLGTEPVQH